jgi:hypothetical protein
MINNIFGKSDQQKNSHGDMMLLNNRFSMNLPQEWEDHSYYRYEGDQPLHRERSRFLLTERMSIG